MSQTAPAWSGPAVARLFQRLLALTFVVAWTSLGSQVDVLVGSRGLLPARDFARGLATRPDLTFFDVPTLFRGDVTDGVLHAGICFGLLLAVLALFGVFPRVAFAVSTVLYLSYAVVARSFLSFQWDNLLLECGLLGALLPTNRRAPWTHFLLRALLFKLYFESGVAKYESSIGDWKDGSAMQLYYETAPLPTWLAWYAHHLPAWWHSLESRATLAFEIGVPFLIFTPRLGRRVAICVFTTFQVVNILTANYGFFSYLALGLSVVLLDDADVRRMSRALGRQLRLRVPSVVTRTRPLRARLRFVRVGYRHKVAAAKSRLSNSTTEKTVSYVRVAFAVVAVAAYVFVSLDDAVDNFWREGPHSDALASLARDVAPFRLVNTYHLFGQITKERVEPTFETFDGGEWVEHDFHYKPGDVTRAPPFVAPHQPRVDFLLWFYGLGYEGRVPFYVKTLLERMCADPSAVQPLFTSPLPSAPDAARVLFYRYHFTSAEERTASGAYWTREPVGTPRTLRCAEVRASQ